MRTRDLDIRVKFYMHALTHTRLFYLMFETQKQNPVWNFQLEFGVYFLLVFISSIKLLFPNHQDWIKRNCTDAKPKHSRFISSWQVPVCCLFVFFSFRTITPQNPIFCQQMEHFQFLRNLIRLQSFLINESQYFFCFWWNIWMHFRSPALNGFRIDYSGNGGAWKGHGSH